MKIVIVGAGEVGCHLAKMLSMERHNISILDTNPERLNKLSEEADVVSLCGSPTSIAMLEKAGVAQADLFVAVSPAQEQDVNILSAILAKRLGSKKVTARINNSEFLEPDHKALFTEMGIDLLFYPEKAAATEIIHLLQQTGTWEFIDYSGGKLQLIVFKLEESAPILNRLLREVPNGTEMPLFRVVAISRSGQTLIPDADTRFLYNDLVFVVSKPESVEYVMERSGKNNIEVQKVMIMGGGQIGELVAKQLENRVELIKLVETNIERCEQLSESLKNVLIINGDARNIDLLVEEELRLMDAFVAVTGSSEANILSCVAAKQAGVKKTIAEVENIDYIRLAEGMGVDAVINKKLITAGRIFRFTMSNNVQSIKCLNGTDAEVLEFIAKPGCLATTHKIRDLHFPREAIIGGAIRGNNSFIAQGDFEIKPYDRVVVFALPAALSKVEKYFA
ncbi:MAG: Trk system potassium transporter TrkA [Prevotellaceae bacterium]|jgi:trk system potassium uptake protein TrkA|nr:Trk system potassium transporter TrkA [Prevotellaceae bacterium]